MRSVFAIILFLFSTHLFSQQNIAINTIVVEGNDSYESSNIRAYSGLKAGMNITGEDIQEAIKNLWALRLFDDIQIYIFPSISPPMSEYRSTLATAEFDCAKGKQRWAASSFFSENKGYGTKHDLGGYTAWFPIKGPSFRIACGKGK